MQRKKISETNKPDLTFPEALKSFQGYLEGTNKASHTIKSYILDIQSFQKYLSQYAPKKVFLNDLSPEDIHQYTAFLIDSGLKINTRRRMILTITRFLFFFAKRKKIPMELGRRNPTPHKLERIPFTISSEEILLTIEKIEPISLIEKRNKILLSTLAETGCLVSEISKIKFDDFVIENNQPFIKIFGKSCRSLPISFHLYNSIQEFKNQKENEWVFLGFNKFGSLGSPMSSRGVELLVKHYASLLGYPFLTPRIFRHSIVLKWLNDGLTKDEIKNRLGLRTDYAFRGYEAAWKEWKEKAALI